MRTIRTAAFLAAVFTLAAASATTASASVTSHNKKMHKLIVLSNPTKLASDAYGHLVATDAAGNEALVSAYDALSGDGRAYLYRKAGGTWSSKPAVTFSAPLPGSGEHFGYAVALSPDGTIAYISADHATVGARQDAGVLYIYRSSKGAWPKKPSQTINDPGAGTNDFFGVGVAVSSDGGTLVVGAPGFTSHTVSQVGRAYVYTAVKGQFSATPAATLASPTPSTRGFFGYSVAVSDNKQGKGVAVVGAYVTSFGAVSAAGAAYVFDAKSLHSWKLATGGRLDDPGKAGNDFFGGVVAINGAGTVIMAGAQDETEKGVGDAGAVFTYRVKAGTWKLSQTLVGPKNGSANFAYPAISVSGTVALAAAPSATINGHAGAGEAFLYAVSPTSFTLDEAVPDPTGGSAASPEYFGNASALDATGTVGVVAAPATGGSGGNPGPGVVYVFSIS